LSEHIEPGKTQVTMGLRITCKSCKASYVVEDGLRGKKILCNECGEPIVVGGGTSPVRPAKGEEDRVTSARPRPAPPAKSAKPAARPRRDEDEDDRDDEDRGPRRRPKKKEQPAGISPVVWVGVGA
jgi:predicted Zn finger-like uncharacterized protein